MKNPDWIREELILALDLYFQLDYGQMHGKNISVIELSKTLRELNLVENISDYTNFRSVGSIALKLANFKKLDQNFNGRGMRAGAKQDREIWNEFHRHRDKLKNEAELIRHLNLTAKPMKKMALSEPKLTYTTDFFFRFHKSKETDPVILKMKKEAVLASSKLLTCEICSFNSVKLYGELGNAVLEVHYSKELKDEPGLDPVDLNDFIVVCANCHKVLDKHYGVINADDLKVIIKKK